MRPYFIETARTIGLAALYVAGAKIGFFLAFLNSQVSPIWPPEGIGLAALLLSGRRALPGIFLGAFAANYWNAPHWESALLIAIGNTSGSFINATVLKKVTGSADPLAATRSLLKFFVFGVIPGAAFSAMVGVTTLLFINKVPVDVYWNVVLTWFSGEMQGFVVVAPLILTWSQMHKEKWEVRRIIEGGLLVTALCCAAWLSFSRNFPTEYIALPFVVLCAFRFGSFGATLCIACLSGIAVYKTIHGEGPFAIFSENGALSLNNTLILLDIYIAVVTATAYLIVTVTRERHAAMEESLKNLITIEKLKDQANRELETKVIERTRVVQQQKQELEEQIQVAEKILFSLLPGNIDEIQGANVGYCYQPMMAIGGDMLDLKHSISEKSLGIFICDVSGHGVAAAFLAAMVKVSLTYWYSHTKDLKGSVDYLHHNLRDKFGENFLTASFAHLNLTTGLLHFVRAGHTPMMIVRKDGRFEEISPKGRMIFFDRVPGCEEVSIQLEKGDRVLFYTDGLVETRDQQGEIIFTEASLARKIASAKGSVPVLCDEILQEVINRSGGRDFLEDDVTLMIVEYVGISKARESATSDPGLVAQSRQLPS